MNYNLSIDRYFYVRLFVIDYFSFEVLGIEAQPNLHSSIFTLSCLAFRVGKPDGRVGKASALAEAAGARCE
jgi:hypothetical protein